MEPTPEEIQARIIDFVKAHPKQKHADIVENLEYLFDPQRIRMNVVALAARGILDYDRIG
jgi:hypothetical protein